MKFRHVGATVGMNIKTFVREPAALFFTFFFPILLMVLFGFIFQNQGNETYTIVVQDLDDTNTSHKFTTALDKLKSVDILKIGRNEDADRYIRDNNLNFLVIIPSGYESGIFARMSYDPNATVNITIKYDPSQNSASIKMSILNAVLQEMNKGMADAHDTVFLKTSSITARSFSFIEFFIPGVIGMTVMTSAVFGTILDENEYKQKGIIRKLSTTPITRGEWILSSMLYQLILAMLSTALILVIGYVVFGASLIISPFLPLVVIVCAFAFSGLGMLLGRLATEAQSASALANVVTFPMMFLAGTFFPMEMIPPGLRIVAKGMPLYYVNEALRQAMIFDNILAAALNTAVIGAFALIVFTAGVYLTTWKQD